MKNSQNITITEQNFSNQKIPSEKQSGFNLFPEV
jgi:hypothetical protein